MKKLLIFSISLLHFSISYCQSIGMGTTQPDKSAQLDVYSSSKGFLPPRMTNNERNAIVNPVAGLIIWNKDCLETQVYNGTVWTNMVGGNVCIPIPGVTICNQVWMTKNLDVDHYRNGDPIPKVTDPTAWANLTTGAWCWYNNDSATYAVTYGKLYNWYSVNDPRGLAPNGWHVPSESDWNKLVKCIDPSADTAYNIYTQSTIAGGAMKETGTAHWLSPNTDATNTSGFTGLPGGTHGNGGAYYNIGYNCYWWSSTMSSASGAWYRYLYYGNAGIVRSGTFLSSGFSVRCLRD